MKFPGKIVEYYLTYSTKFRFSLLGIYGIIEGQSSLPFSVFYNGTVFRVLEKATFSRAVSFTVLMTTAKLFGV